MADAANSTSFPVKILTPETVVWDGQAEVLSSTNSAGRFDILPEHANMITVIERAPIEVISAGGNRNFTFEKAVIVVQNGVVTVYANIEASDSPEEEKIDKSSKS